jgi:hypothetical protein
MDSKLGISITHDSVTPVTLQKMVFLYNALHQGWEIKTKNDKYVFTKKHEGEREIHLENFLRDFVKNNMEGKHVIL